MGTGDVAMMKNSRRPVMRLVTATAVAVPILLVSGCGNSLSGSSTCQEFLNSSTADQDQIVSSLAAKYRKQAYATLPSARRFAEALKAELGAA